MYSKRLLCVVNAALGLLLLIIARSVTHAQNVPIDGHVTIIPFSNVVMQGEPIVLRLRVNSDDIKPFCVDFGAESTNWDSHFAIRLALSDMHSKAAPTVVSYRHKGPLNGFYGFNRHCIAPGKSDQGQFIVTRRLPAPPPGEYRLSVHVDIPCFAGDDEAVMKMFTGKPDDMMHKDETIALTVLPADPARLRQMAEKWRQQIIVWDHTHDPPDPMHIDQPYHALFSLPEAIALPVWREILLDPHLYWIVKQEANKELVRLGTLAAGNLLVEVAQAQEPRTDNARAAHFALVDFYANAPAPVKTQLRTTIMAIVGYL